ncbi:MAG: glycosyl transferase, partial [Bacillota bacterium]|nr:glycosyl transferase [Bacillota bacterium]
ADCFQRLGDKEKELEYLLKSFEYASPRAEFCCRLGYYFLCAEQYEQGAFWYRLATQLEKPVDCWGPLIESCWTWLPHLQLCVCYDRLGKHELAYKHNELAGNYIPDDPKIIYNRNYLKGVLHLDDTETE